MALITIREWPPSARICVARDHWVSSASSVLTVPCSVRPASKGEQACSRSRARPPRAERAPDPDGSPAPASGSVDHGLGLPGAPSPRGLVPAIAPAWAIPSPGGSASSSLPASPGPVRTGLDARSPHSGAGDPSSPAGPPTRQRVPAPTGQCPMTLATDQGGHDQDQQQRPGVALTAALAGIGHPLEGGREGRILGRLQRGTPSVLSHTDCPRWTPTLTSPCHHNEAWAGETIPAWAVDAESTLASPLSSADA